MAHQHLGHTFNAHRLEHPYGVGMMDDIHNFFPELLYDASLFATPLVGFLQRRVQTLFEEDYSRNRTQYRMFQQTRRRRESGIFVPATQLMAATTVPLTVPLSTTIPATWGSLDETMGGLFATLGIQGLNSLLTQVQQPSPPEEEEPQTPTVVQIQAASLLTSIEPPADVECSICQDHNGPNNQTEWRILRHCNHRFHRSCIDTWFQRNTHCPVCRHDIREEAYSS